MVPVSTWFAALIEVLCLLAVGGIVGSLTHGNTGWTLGITVAILAAVCSGVYVLAARGLDLPDAVPRRTIAKLAALNVVLLAIALAYGLASLLHVSTHTVTLSVIVLFLLAVPGVLVFNVVLAVGRARRQRRERQR
jgi:hypothetical protein